MKTYEDCIHNNTVVNHMVQCGRTHEEIIVALCNHNKALIDKVMELDSRAPRKFEMPDGTLMVWHCPDHLLPTQKLEP